MAPDLPRQAVDAKSSLGRDDLPHGRPIDWHDQAFQYQFNGIPYPINAGSHDAYQYKAQAQQQPAAYNAPFDMHDMASALPMEQYGQVSDPSRSSHNCDS